MTQHRRRSRWIAGLAIVAGFAVLPSAPASAHTDFESSTPAAGDVVDSPLSEITIAFTSGAEESGEGFSVFDGKGAVRTPDTIEIVDGRIFVLGFDPPLTPGEIGVRWEVRAGDAHPIDGSFTFTLNAPPATIPPTTPAPATTLAPATTSAPPTTVDAAPTTDAAEPAETTSPADEQTTTTVASAGDQDDELSPGSLDEFLAGDGSDEPGGGLQTLGRALSIPFAALAIGAFAFLATTLRGSSDEIALVLRGLAIGGGALAIGAAIELFGWLDGSGESFGDAWNATPGAAMTLRVVAGVLLIAGAVLADAHARSSHPPRAALSAAIADAPPVATSAPPRRWSLRSAPLLAVGTVIVIVSFWFDGHTVSRGPRVVHAIVNSVHVAAAGAWVGGVIAFAAIAWRRHRRDEPSHATELIVRFSTVATIALVAVTLAGAVMTGLIIDGPGDLTSTEWGKTLLVKTGAVVVAASMGAFNHFRLRPALERDPDDPALAAELRRTLIAEVIVLVFVAIVTAWLVAAAI